MNPCPKCGTPLHTGVAEGLCPRCLLDAGMEQDDAPASGWTPPALDRVAAILPDLDVLALIGQGGMGAVYQARQRRLDRLVAVKVLSPELGESPEFTERFSREARALAKLSHANIVGIHDFGMAEGLCYVVMEHVEGRSLRQLLQDGSLDPAHAMHIAPQICDALQYAHDRGVIHRDIKPENILVDTSGRVRIADFGLAKLVEEPQPEALTGTHQVMGTPHYMAPEQTDGRGPLDHRVDIYALGVVLYETLTGRLPVGHFPPPSATPGVPADLDGVVLKCLERDPSDRGDSAAGVRREIEAAGAAPAAPAPRQSRFAPPLAPLPKPPRAYVAILVAGLVAFVGMFMEWSSIPWSKLSAEFGRLTGNRMSFDESDSDSPFNDPFFDKSRKRFERARSDIERRREDIQRQMYVTADAWHSNLLGIPNGLLGIAGIAFAALAGITLATGWRAPLMAYGIPAGWGVLQTLGFLVTLLSYGGTPQLGCIVTLGASATVGLAALQLRPPRARTLTSGAHAKTTRRRRRARAARPHRRQ